MFTVALLALLVSTGALVFAGLTWSNSVKARRAAEASATSASTSADQAVTSADAAQRSAAVAEETVGYAREDRATRRRAERTPRFDIVEVEGSIGSAVDTATLRMLSSEPVVEYVDVSLVGGLDLAAMAPPAGTAPGLAPSLRWCNPGQLEPFNIALRRDEASGYGQVMLRLSCQLGSDDNHEVRVIDLGPV